VNDYSGIPAELRNLPRWVVWRWGDVDPKTGKRKKPPFCPTDLRRHGSSTDEQTWATFDQALAIVEAGKADGVGFALCPPYVGVDLDEELPGADQGAVMGVLDSYSEHSPSGKGYHVVIRADLNGAGRHPQGIGVFQVDRLWYCTGEHVRGTPTTIEERQDELEKVVAHFLPATNVATDPWRVSSVNLPAGGKISDLDDRELLDRAMAARNGAEFTRLWNGDSQGYRSRSEADLAFCNMLSFWTGRDAERVDQLFRQSGLYREKWERDDYRNRTIETAIAATTDVYKPSPAVSSANAEVPSNASQTASLQVINTFQRGTNQLCGRDCDLEAVVDRYGQLLLVKDTGAVVVTLASIVANYAKGDALALFLVGPPGCGKSETVSSIRRASDVHAIASLTPQTLLSGFERKGKDAENEPASLLLRIGLFGILALKDLTTVLSMHHEAKSQIISQLREVADGRYEKAFGNGLFHAWEGKLGIVGGVTPIIDEQHAFISVMGERFVLYRMPEVSREEIARRALQMRGREEEIRDGLSELAAGFLERFRDVGHIDHPDRFTDPIIKLTDIVTRARTGVARDRQTRDILYLPEPEAPTRLAKQLAQLLSALLVIGVDEDEAWRLVDKVGWDCVPAVRASVIRLLSRYPGEELTRADLQEKTGLPESTVRRVEEDLVVLGLAEHRKDGDAQSARWLIRESRIGAEYWEPAG